VSGSFPITITATNGVGTNATQSFTLTVGESTTTALNLSVASVYTGSETVEVFTATVTGISGGGVPTGTVAIKNGSTLLCTTGTLSGSGITATATCSLTASQLSTSGSPYTITAVYSGSSSYLGSTSAGQTLNVDSAIATSSITLTTVSSVTYGAETSEQFGATVSISGSGLSGTTPTGSVLIKNGTTLLATCTTSPSNWVHTSGLWTGTVTASSCTLTAVELPAASYTTITAEYTGDTNYGGAVSSNGSFTVAKDTTTATVSETPSTVTYGNESASTFTVTVTTGHHELLPATESVTVNVGTASCIASVSPSGNGGSGTCTITNAALAASGTVYAVTATYGGDTDLSAASTATASPGLTVNKVAATVGLVTSNATPSTGQQVTFTATVSGAERRLGPDRHRYLQSRRIANLYDRDAHERLGDLQLHLLEHHRKPVLRHRGLQPRCRPELRHQHLQRRDGNGQFGSCLEGLDDEPLHAHHHLRRRRIGELHRHGQRHQR
jgi:hypothetical protein